MLRSGWMPAPNFPFNIILVRTQMNQIGQISFDAMQIRMSVYAALESFLYENPHMSLIVAILVRNQKAEWLGMFQLRQTL